MASAVRDSQGSTYTDVFAIPAARGQPLEARPWLAGQDGAHTIGAGDK